MGTAERMLRRPVVLLLALTSACGDDGGPTAPSGAAVVEGTWTFFETLTTADRTVRCSDEGRLDLAGIGLALHGYGYQSGTCTGPGGPVGNSGADSVRNGQATDTTIRFTFGGCSYQARLIASPPDSVTGTVTCEATGPQGTILSGTWFAARGLDENPPSVFGVQVPPIGDTLFVPSDTFRLTVSAEDDRRLLWIGYRLGAPASLQDSVRVVATTGQASFELPMAIPPAWLGMTPLVLFARDAFNRVTEDSSRVLRVFNLVRRRSSLVSLGAVATDVEYDSKRNMLYFLEPANGRIAVLSLNDLSFGTPIPVPTDLPATESEAMDLSPSGDSLVVAVTTPAGLHFINLENGRGSTELIVDQGSDSPVLLDARVASGRAFAYGQRTDRVTGYTTGRLWELNLATKAQQVRTDAGASGDGNLGLNTEFVTSNDGSRMLLIDPTSRCMQVFSLGTGFGPCAAPPPELNFVPSGSNDGSEWLVRHLLYDAGLTVRAEPVPEGTPPGVLASDASVAYYPTPLGFDVIELPAGTVREHVRVPNRISRLTLLPEAGRIAAWTSEQLVGDFIHLDRITVVDLQ
jgi:hypothetical protein